MRIALDTPNLCQAELEACSNGLAQLDHLYSTARSRLDEIESAWQEWEDKAAGQVRKPDDPKSLTAKEITARINGYLRKHDEAMEILEELRTVRRQLDKIDRWFRTLEKRGSHAQAALKGHMNQGAYGGSGA